MMDLAHREKTEQLQLAETLAQRVDRRPVPMCGVLVRK